MDQNNMSQQENTGGQPTEQVQNPYVQPAEQVQNPYMAPMNQQPAYQPPVFSEDVSMGEWMWTLLLVCIPFVNLIPLLFWAFSSSTKASKANFSKAVLLWMVICFCLSIVLVILGFIFGISLGFKLFNDYMRSVAVIMALM
ncbi:MAG: hypothetical protein K2K20_03415 [Lachnospiraceae bacterium]|nr:hypothetical protein [Lachnospiraceae bacterium]